MDIYSFDPMAKERAFAIALVDGQIWLQTTYHFRGNGYSIYRSLLYAINIDSTEFVTIRGPPKDPGRCATLRPNWRKTEMVTLLLVSLACARWLLLGRLIPSGLVIVAS